MKIVVWEGCKVIAEHNHPTVPGPDLHLDPTFLPNTASWRHADGTVEWVGEVTP